MEPDEIFSDLEEEEEVEAEAEAEAVQGPDEGILPLSCDECGENCFKESYFIEEREEDYCVKCYGNLQLTGGEYRRENKYFYVVPNELYVKEAIEILISQVERVASYPPLFESARRGDLDAVRYHVERCSEDVNSVDSGGTPLLHLPCMLRHTDTIKYLLDRGADATKKDALGKKAFEYILDRRLRREIEIFAWYCTPEGRMKYKSENIEPDNASVPSHIWSAAFKGNLRRLREFLQKNRNLCNAQDVKGNTPLMFAAMADRLDAMSDLLYAGGDLNVKNKSGFSALTFAKGPSMEKRILKLAHQASPIGQKEDITRKKKVELIIQRTIFKKLYFQHAHLKNMREYIKELEEIRARTIADLSVPTALVPLEIGLDNVLKRYLQEEKELKAYLERLRQEDEERERQRLIQKLKDETIAANLRKQALEAEARRLAEEEAERLLFQRNAAAALARQKENARLLAEQKALEERLALEAKLREEERERRKQALIQKDIEDRPIKVYLSKRLFQGASRLK